MEKTLPDSKMMNDPAAGHGREEHSSEQHSSQAQTDPVADAEKREGQSTPIEYALPEHTIEEGSVGADELQMLKKNLPEPKVEAGDGLVQSIESIPDKMAFKIGEAAEMVGVKQYVLRYWESEFDMLRPRKSKNNQRVYSRKDIETALMIKKLLYDDRFSIEGARTALRQLKTQVKEERGIKAMAQSQETAVTKLKGLVSEIRRIRDIFC